MDLLQLKTRRDTTWTKLADSSGISAGNLSRIARGKRGWDVRTGWQLRQLGVSLDCQIEVFAAENGLLTLPAANDCEPVGEEAAV